MASKLSHVIREGVIDAACTDCNKRYLFKEGLADWLCAECFKHRLPHNSRCDWKREKCSCHHVLRYVAAHKVNKQATIRNQ
jgi:hypothetical protein